MFPGDADMPETIEPMGMEHITQSYDIHVICKSTKVRPKSASNNDRHCTHTVKTPVSIHIPVFRLS